MFSSILQYEFLNGTRFAPHPAATVMEPSMSFLRISHRTGPLLEAAGTTIGAASHSHYSALINIEFLCVGAMHWWWRRR